MKHYCILLISILYFSCKTEKPKEVFPYPAKEEIVAIVETIITENKLPVLKATIAPDTIIDKERKLIVLPVLFPLVSDLSKLTVIHADTGMFVPRSFQEVYIQNLLQLRTGNKQFFNQNDSTFFLFQNDTLKTLDLNKELSPKYNTATSQEQNAKPGKPGNSYYDISIPIFSKDLLKAYVQVNHYCNGLCGSGSYVLLEKINGKWTIIESQTTWIS